MIVSLTCTRVRIGTKPHCHCQASTAPFLSSSYANWTPWNFWALPCCPPQVSTGFSGLVPAWIPR
eukprot:166350-Rhodomonas_salina.1